MRTSRLVLILTVMAAGALLALYRTVSVRAADGIHIISPRSGEAVSGNSVSLRYEIRDLGLPSTMYELQLDDGVPVRTSENVYTFTQLNPGQHNVRVQMIPAGGNKPSATAAVRFSTSSGQGELPEAGGELPLLSLIGFGVLLGGIASALRTR